MQHPETWLQKYEDVATRIDRLRAKIKGDKVKADGAPSILLDTLEAAKMICRSQYLKESSQAKASEGSASQIAADVLASQALGKPIAFCRLFWLMETPTRERSTILRPPLDEIERALKAKMKPGSAVYSMTKVFGMLMAGSHFGDCEHKVAKVYEDTMIKLFREGFMPCFASVPALDSNERTAALKALRGDVTAAFDLAAKREKGSIHGSATTLVWRDEKGHESEVLPAWAAIQYTRRILEKGGRIPTKFEVRSEMEASHPSLIEEGGKTFWAKIWKASGLMSLPEGRKWTRK
jgi:hypothetical protein